MSKKVRPPLAVWQSEPCPSWCDLAGLHGHEDEPNDRRHVGQWMTIRQAACQGANEHLT